jgi:hypothetical protein
VCGSKNREGIDLGSNENVFGANNIEDLTIKEPDEYSNGHVDGRMFAGLSGKSVTAHVWLNTYSRGNVITVKIGETVVDDGEDNQVTIIDEEE